MVWAQPPANDTAVWPDLIVVNGAEYQVESPGRSVYKGQSGAVINFN